MKKAQFFATIRIEGINPYVDPPLGTGRKLGKVGVVPVGVRLDGRAFRANLMPLGPKRTGAKKGEHHRLYLHGVMRRSIGKDVGDRVKVELAPDTRPRVEPVNPGLARGLKGDPVARSAFRKLSPSHRKELNRYLNHLKGAEALRRNLDKVLGYLRDPEGSWFGKKKSR